MFSSSLPPIVCWRAHVLFTLFAYSGVQHILCCVFLRLVYPILQVSLDWPFLIASSVFSNFYLQFLWIVHFWLPLRYSLTFFYSFSGLSISDCLFGILKSLFSLKLITCYWYFGTCRYRTPAGLFMLALWCNASVCLPAKGLALRLWYLTPHV